MDGSTVCDRGMTGMEGGAPQPVVKGPLSDEGHRRFQQKEDRQSGGTKRARTMPEQSWSLSLTDEEAEVRREAVTDPKYLPALSMPPSSLVPLLEAASSSAAAVDKLLAPHPTKMDSQTC